MNQPATAKAETSWLQPARRASEQALGWIRRSGLAAWRGAVSFVRGDDLTFVASIAFYALLSLFPLFMLAFSALGTVTADEADRAAVLQFVLRYLPDRTELVTGQLDALRGASVELGLVGTGAIIWTALGVFRSITVAVNHAWGVKESGGFLQHQLLAFVMLLAGGVLLIAAFLLISAIRVVQASWFVDVLDLLPGLELLTGFAFRYATTILLVLVVGLIFYFVPNTEVRLLDVWAVAILTCLLWRLALEGFSWYVSEPSRFSVHGSLAAVVVFLLWVYVEAAILLYGAEFTAAYA